MKSTQIYILTLIFSYFFQTIAFLDYIRNGDFSINDCPISCKWSTQFYSSQHLKNWLCDGSCELADGMLFNPNFGQMKAFKFSPTNRTCLGQLISDSMPVGEYVLSIDFSSASTDVISDSEIRVSMNGLLIGSLIPQNLSLANAKIVVRMSEQRRGNFLQFCGVGGLAQIRSNSSGGLLRGVKLVKMEGSNETLPNNLNIQSGNLTIETTQLESITENINSSATTYQATKTSTTTIEPQSYTSASTNSTQSIQQGSNTVTGLNVTFDNRGQLVITKITTSETGSTTNSNQTVAQLQSANTTASNTTLNNTTTVQQQQKNQTILTSQTQTQNITQQNQFLKQQISVIQSSILTPQTQNLTQQQSSNNNNLVHNPLFLLNTCLGKYPCKITKSSINQSQLNDWQIDPQLELGLSNYYNPNILLSTQQKLSIRMPSSSLSTCIRQQFYKLQHTFYQLYFSYAAVLSQKLSYQPNPALVIVKFNGRNIKNILPLNAKLNHAQLLIKAIKDVNVLQFCSFGQSQQLDPYFGTIISNIVMYQKQKLTDMRTNFIANGDFQINSCFEKECKWATTNFNQQLIKYWYFTPLITLAKGTEYNVNAGRSRVAILPVNSCLRQTLSMFTTAPAPVEMHLSWTVPSNDPLYQSLIQIRINSQVKESYVAGDYRMHRETILAKFKQGFNTIEICALGLSKAQGFIVDDIAAYMIDGCAVNNARS